MVEVAVAAADAVVAAHLVIAIAALPVVAAVEAVVQVGAAVVFHVDVRPHYGCSLANLLLISSKMFGSFVRSLLKLERTISYS